jgi:hypothetical protein
MNHWKSTIQATCASLAYFPYSEKIKEGLCDLHAVCESHRQINFGMPEPIFIKLGMYIMASEPISTAYLTNPSHRSVCMCIVARQRLGNTFPR